MNAYFIRYVLAFLIITLLQACGGGNSAGGGSATNVFGVAATGLAINGNITLKDATGTTRSAAISQPSGAFSLDVAGLTPPYFLKASDSNGINALYSVATGPGNFNINPISNLAVLFAAMNVDSLVNTPDAAFNNPTKFANLTSGQIEAATTSVMAKMSPAFLAALSANGANNVNPLTDTFQVGNGLDLVFDNFVITFDSVTGEIKEQQVASNTTTVIGLVANGQIITINGGAVTPPGMLIIAANPASKAYDGQLYSGGNGVAYFGLVNGDTPAVLGGTLTYSGTSQGATNVGSYTITPGGLSSNNYNIVYEDSTLTISQAVLAVPVVPVTKIYSGTTTTGTATGFINGDTTINSGTLTTTDISGTLTTTGIGGTLTTAGASSPSASTITLGGGLATNYSSSTTIPTATITPVTLTAN